MFASGGQDGKIRLWRHRQLLASFDVSTDLLSEVEFSPCGRRFAVVSLKGSVSAAGRVTMFDAQTRAPLWEAEFRDPPEALRNVVVPQLSGRQVAFEPTGETVICLDTDFSIREYDARSGHVTGLYALPGQSPPVRIRLSPDGRFLLAQGMSGDAAVVDRKTGKVCERLQEPAMTYHGAVRTARGDLWLRSDALGTCFLGSAPSAEPLQVLHGMQRSAEACATSRDGRYLAVGGWDRVLYFWGLQDGGSPRKFIGHDAVVRGLIFSPDDRTILSQSYDGTARLWHVPTSAELIKLGTPDDQIICMGLNPNGTLLVLGLNCRGRHGLRFYHLRSQQD